MLCDPVATSMQHAPLSGGHNVILQGHAPPDGRRPELHGAMTTDVKQATTARRRRRADGWLGGQMCAADAAHTIGGLR